MLEIAFGHGSYQILYMSFQPSKLAETGLGLRPGQIEEILGRRCIN